MDRFAHTLFLNVNERAGVCRCSTSASMHPLLSSARFFGMPPLHYTLPSCTHPNHSTHIPHPPSTTTTHHHPINHTNRHIQPHLTTNHPQKKQVPAGRLPRHKEVILTHDLIDCARPGEEIDVTGVFVYGYDASLNIKNSFPVFSTHIEANYVSKREVGTVFLKGGV